MVAMQEMNKPRVSKENGVLKGKSSLYRAVFWFLLGLSLYWLAGSQVSEASSHRGIVLTGEVPASLEYLFILRKNSSIAMSQEQRNVAIEGILRGFQGIPKTQQKLFFYVMDEFGSMLQEGAVLTGSNGEFSFSFHTENVKTVEVRIEKEGVIPPLETFLFPTDFSYKPSVFQEILTLLP